MRRFQDLTVWQKSHHLVLGIYRVTKHFPVHERYGLVAQMRRAAISTPANVAEGHKRRSKREFSHFLSIAEGSLEEVKYYLLLAKDLDYLGGSDAESLYQKAEEAGRMLYGLKHHVKQEVANEQVAAL